MGHPQSTNFRTLPGSVQLRNQLLAALPDDVLAQVVTQLRMTSVAVGDVLHEDGVAVKDVFFPNGGVYSVTSHMSDGSLVEVATVGTEGMLGVNVFLGDQVSPGHTLLQVPGDCALPTMTVADFVRHTSEPGPFRDVVARYTQVHILQAMQSTACNALHKIEQRCARWLLQTHDRVRSDEFLLKHEFLAAMLGSSRPTVTLVMGTLQKAGLISYRYGRVCIRDRESLEECACECYATIRGHFDRLAPPSQITSV
jgi:CRP-like cAMP-binding protein